jgi:hypothetical protein
MSHNVRKFREKPSHLHGITSPFKIRPCRMQVQQVWRIIKLRYTSPLNTGEHEIRLVRAASQEINCHLETANLDLSPSHEALSYEWGTENSAEREAILDSGRVSVRENMWWAALYHLRN